MITKNIYKDEHKKFRTNRKKHSNELSFYVNDFAAFANRTMPLSAIDHNNRIVVNLKVAKNPRFRE